MKWKFTTKASECLVFFLHWFPETACRFDIWDKFVISWYLHWFKSDFYSWWFYDSGWFCVDTILQILWSFLRIKYALRCLSASLTLGGDRYSSEKSRPKYFLRATTSSLRRVEWAQRSWYPKTAPTWHASGVKIIFMKYAGFVTCKICGGHVYIYVWLELELCIFIARTCTICTNAIAPA